MAQDQKHSEGVQRINAISALIIRSLALIPVIATFFISAAMMFYGGFNALKLMTSFVSGHSEGNETYIFAAIEIVDIFMLAVVIQVVSVGLFQLYIREDTSLPRFLIVDTLDDLKSKLVGVIITILAVTFLQHALEWQSGTDILYLGAGTALVIYALTQFFRHLK